MTRFVKAELLKLRSTRTALVLLALAAAGTAALVALVLLLAGRPGRSLGADALRQLVLVPAQPLTLAALVLGILGMAGGVPPRHRHRDLPGHPFPGAGWWRPSSPPPPSPAWSWRCCPRRRCSPSACPGCGPRGSRSPWPTPAWPRGRPGWPSPWPCSPCSGSGSPRVWQPGGGRGRGAAVVVTGRRGLLAGLLRQPGLERWLPMGAASALTRPGDGTLPMWAGALVFGVYGLVLALAGGRLRGAPRPHLTSCTVVVVASTAVVLGARLVVVVGSGGVVVVVGSTVVVAASCVVVVGSTVLTGAGGGSVVLGTGSGGPGVAGNGRARGLRGGPPWSKPRRPARWAGRSRAVAPRRGGGGLRRPGAGALVATEGGGSAGRGGPVVAGGSARSAEGTRAFGDVAAEGDHRGQDREGEPEGDQHEAPGQVVLGQVAWVPRWHGLLPVRSTLAQAPDPTDCLIQWEIRWSGMM